MNVLGVLGVMLLLAFIVESMVEYLVGQVFDQIHVLTPYKWTLIYVSALVGVFGAVVYQFDLLSLLAQFLEVQLAQSVLGSVLTGLAIGRGANYLHDLVSKYFVRPS